MAATDSERDFSILSEVDLSKQPHYLSSLVNKSKGRANANRIANYDFPFNDMVLYYQNAIEHHTAEHEPDGAYTE